MDITLTSAGTYRFSSMRTVHLATAEEKNNAAASGSDRDQVTISEEGRDRLEILADKTEAWLNSITREDFMAMVEQWKRENPLEVEANPYFDIDPDGSIARKTYFESYFGQLQEMEDTIKAYYADAYQEAVSAPIDSLTFISGKYLRSWSDYYVPGIPAKERQWTHFQLRAMLTGTHVSLNDPYALAASGGTKTVDEMDAIARQAVKDKLDELLKEKSNPKKVIQKK